jgi:predicted membrane-bound mannosyltransferase
MRFYMLAEKPPHHDESINGWFILQMWKTGYFRYDPTNYHGPLLFYLLQLGEMLFGDSLWTLRAVVSLFSFLTVAAFCWRAVYENKYWFLGAVVLIFSPGAAFFGRSAIHESVLVF